MIAASREFQTQGIEVRSLGSGGAPTDAVLDRVQMRFRTSPYVALRRLRCEYRGGVLVLHGRVASYYLKQLAQEVVRRLAGVEEIANHVEVFDGE
jgi:hypothetical protein